MNYESEINLGYRGKPAGQRRSSGPLHKTSDSPQRFRRFKRKIRTFRKKIETSRKGTLQIVLLPFLILTSLIMIVGLKLYLWLRRYRVTNFYERALQNVSKFVEQYPFHLYPIVCKSFELAFFEDKFANLVQQKVRVLEVAIGDGSLSKRIFPAGAQVVGLDLNPYILKKASEMEHVKQAIVCDCLRPPINTGSFEVLIANNFLHHVTHKEQTLASWAGIAETAIFNENTPYWASSWFIPYILKTLGLEGAASRSIDRIKRESLQSLDFKDNLDAIVLRHYENVESISYMSESTFFCCGIFSFLMRCYGPPTPETLKRLFLRHLRWIAIPLTTTLAKLLIRFDQYQDRSRDAFISYVCKSKSYVSFHPEYYLVCPACGGELAPSNRCRDCETQYTITDGMLFLLCDELKYIHQEYKPDIAAKMTPEQL